MSASATAVGVAGSAALTAGVVGGDADTGSADLGALVVPRDQWLDCAAAAALGRRPEHGVVAAQADWSDGPPGVDRLGPTAPSARLSRASAPVAVAADRLALLGPVAKDLRTRVVAGVADAALGAAGRDAYVLPTAAGARRPAAPAVAGAAEPSFGTKLPQVASHRAAVGATGTDHGVSGVVKDFSKPQKNRRTERTAHGDLDQSDRRSSGTGSAAGRRRVPGTAGRARWCGAWAGRAYVVVTHFRVMVRGRGGVARPGGRGSEASVRRDGRRLRDVNSLHKVNGCALQLRVAEIWAFCNAGAGLTRALGTWRHGMRVRPTGRHPHPHDPGTRHDRVRDVPAPCWETLCPFP